MMQVYDLLIIQNIFTHTQIADKDLLHSRTKTDEEQAFFTDFTHTPIQMLLYSQTCVRNAKSMIQFFFLLGTQPLTNSV